MILRPILICNINCTYLSKKKCTYKRLLTLLSLEWFIVLLSVLVLCNLKHVHTFRHAGWNPGWNVTQSSGDSWSSIRDWFFLYPYSRHTRLLLVYYTVSTCAPTLKMRILINIYNDQLKQRHITYICMSLIKELIRMWYFRVQ